MLSGGYSNILQRSCIAQAQEYSQSFVLLWKLQCSSQQHTSDISVGTRANRVMIAPNRTAAIQAAPLGMPLFGARHPGAGGVRKETKKNAMELKTALSRGKMQAILLMSLHREFELPVSRSIVVSFLCCTTAIPAVTRVRTDKVIHRSTLCGKQCRRKGFCRAFHVYYCPLHCMNADHTHCGTQHSAKECRPGRQCIPPWHHRMRE